MAQETAKIGDIIEITNSHPDENIRGLRAKVTTALGAGRPFVQFHPLSHKPPTIIHERNHYDVIARAGTNDDERTQAQNAFDAVKRQ